MIPHLTQAAYLAATVLFVFSLKWLSHPSTARRGVLALGLGPGFRRIAAVQLRRGAPERVLRRGQLALGDGQEAIGADTETFLEFQLLLEALAAQAERGAGFRGQVGLHRLDVRPDGVGRFDRGVG